MAEAGLKEWINKFKIPIALSLLGIVLIIGGLITSQSKNQSKNFPTASIVEAQKTISVDISGAVQNPGVYQLSEASRVEEVIQKAGGFSEDSNQEYISKYLNLAQKLVDGMKIYVPFQGETGAVAGAGAVSGQTSKININTASQSELESLSGVGPVTASKIISGRPYQSVEELVDKKIVSKSVFEKIKDSVSLF